VGVYVQVDPILAQGAGVAIEDAYELTMQLKALAGSTNSNGNGIAVALRQYEAATATRVEILRSISDLSQRLGTAGPPLSAVRDLAFLLTPQAIKGYFFDYAIRLSLSRSWSLRPGEFGYHPDKLINS